MSQFYKGPPGGGATGNVTGPASSTDNAIARFDGTTGRIIQNSGVTISDTDVMAGVELTLTTALDPAYGGSGQTSYVNGELLIGTSAGNTLAKSTLIGGTGISITNGAGSIQIDATGGGFSWSEVTGTSQTIAVENGYISNNAALVTFTLPTTASLGDDFQIIGKGAGLFKIAQGAGQTINIVASSTTTGVGGSLTAIEQFACIELVCTTANSGWTVIDMTGNYTVV